MPELNVNEAMMECMKRVETVARSIAESKDDAVDKNAKQLYTLWVVRDSTTSTMMGENIPVERSLLMNRALNEDKPLMAVVRGTFCTCNPIDRNESWKTWGGNYLVVGRIGIA